MSRHIFLLGDDTGLAKNTQVMGGRRLGKSDLFGNLRDIAGFCAVRFGREEAKNLQTNWIANRPELLSEHLQI
jgi:hypothetical protein